MIHLFVVKNSQFGNICSKIFLKIFIHSVKSEIFCILIFTVVRSEIVYFICSCAGCESWLVILAVE